MAGFKFNALTYVGRRKNNQDSCFADKISNGFHFLAVADGMGGAAGGEIASQTVIETAKSILENVSETKIDSDKLKEVLGQIFDASQRALAAKIEKDSQLAGMGTTLTCVLLLDNKYAWGNIGDSRIYLVSDEDIVQLTDDHTYIQDHINKHGDDIPEHFYKKYGHIITRSINGENDKPDLYPSESNYITLNKEELFLLCSDGLISDKIFQEPIEFRNIIQGNKDLLVTSKNLISYAFAKGSTDNITVVLGEYGDLKRNRKTIPSFEYPPKEQKIEEAENAVSSAIDAPSIDETHELKQEEIPLPKVHSSNSRGLKIVLISILLLIIIGAGGYLFLNKETIFPENSKSNAVIQSEDNQLESATDQTALKIMDFDGFEYPEMEEYLTDNPMVTWTKYTGDGLEKYLIVVDGKNDFKFSETEETNAKLSDFGITKPGTYKLTIGVILNNNEIVDGSRKLTLKVK